MAEQQLRGVLMVLRAAAQISAHKLSCTSIEVRAGVRAMYVCLHAYVNVCVTERVLLGEVLVLSLSLQAELHLYKPACVHACVCD